MNLHTIPEIISTEKEKEPSVPAPEVVNTEKEMEPAPIRVSVVMATEQVMEL